MTDTHTVVAAPATPPSNDGWMTDVQRAIALIFVTTFCLCIVVMVVRLTFWGTVDDVSDMLKIALPALITLVTGVIGYFYGSSKSKDASDASQAKLVTTLATNPLPPSPPPAAGPGTAWWGKLTDDEKNAITGAKTGDARIDAIVSAATSGTATADDLAYLVSKNLLTQARADALKAA